LPPINSLLVASIIGMFINGNLKLMSQIYCIPD
jgi:hypothetical protein